MASDERFRGFPPEGLRFLGQLRRHNERAWFAPRKALYERDVLEPMRAFVADASRALACAGLPIGGDAKRSIFRVYRDVRFSADKRPYRTNAAAYLSYDGGRQTQGGIYLQIAPRECRLSAAFYQIPPPMLRRWREAMREDPRRFAGVLRALVRRGLEIEDPAESDDALRRMPRGFEALGGHELAPYFRLRSFCAGRDVEESAVNSRRLIDLVVRFGRDARPLFDFGWSVE